MQIQGVVVTISLSKQIKGQSKTYEGWELVYRDMEDAIKTIQKPVQGLKFAPNLKAGLAALSPGDEFTLTQEKNASGFWDVKNVEKGHVVQAAAPVNTSSAKPQRSNNYQDRDFESKEERTKKQEYIIRQSSISSAIAVLTTGAKAAPKPEEVLALADQFVAYVYNNGAKNAAGASGFDDFEDDIPY